MVKYSKNIFGHGLLKMKVNNFHNKLFNYLDSPYVRGHKTPRIVHAVRCLHHQQHVQGKTSFRPLCIEREGEGEK